MLWNFLISTWGVVTIVVECRSLVIREFHDHLRMSIETFYKNRIPKNKQEKKS